MSLTSELRDYKSRLRRFMVATFPRTKRFSRAANRTPAPSPAPSPDAWKQTQIAGIGQVQYAVVQSPPRSRKRPQIAKAQPDAASGTIGTAFDYRVRYYFRATPCQKLIAYQGAADLVGDGQFNAKLMGAFFARLEGFVARVQPHRKTLSARDERELARYCLALALLEQRFRIGEFFYETESVLLSIGPQKADPGALLALAKQSWVEDLVGLSRGFRKSQLDLIKRSAVLNPVFAGSADVGGADADLIVGRCLIDLKTSVRAEVSRQVLYQLLGYVLLDYGDKYRLNRVGVYWAREERLAVWELPKLLSELTGEAQVNLAELRRKFRAAIKPRTARRTSKRSA